MRLRVCAMAAAFLTLAMGQNPPELKHVMAAPLTGTRSVSLAAVSIERGPEYPSVIRLNGEVEIRTPVCVPTGTEWAEVCDGDMVVRADAAEYHEDTGQIEAHGNVVVTPLLHRKKP